MSYPAVTCIRETLITAPTAEPVTLSDAKAHLRVETSGDDALITALIIAARQAAENYTARSLLTQTWDFFFDSFPLDWPYELLLPRGYCQSVSYVKHLDPSSVEQTLVANTDYQVSTAGDVGGRIKPVLGRAWPAVKSDTYEAVRVRAVLGWTNSGAALLPAPLIHAVKMLVGHFYENRETVLVGTTAVELPIGAQALMNPFVLLHFA